MPLRASAIRMLLMMVITVAVMMSSGVGRSGVVFGDNDYHDDVFDDDDDVFGRWALMIYRSRKP